MIEFILTVSVVLAMASALRVIWRMFK